MSSANTSTLRRVAAYARWLQWPLAVALLAWLFDVNRESLADFAQREIRYGWAVAGLVLCGGAMLLTFVRWYLLVWAQEFDFTLRDGLRLGFLGYFFNFVLPAGSVGGDMVKAVMIARTQRRRRTVAVATILLDRILGLWALFLVGAGVSLMQSGQTDHAVFQAAAAVFWIGSAAGMAGLGLMMHPAVPRWTWLKRLVQVKWIGRPLGELINGILLYQTRRRVLWAAVGISLAGHFAMLSSFYCCARAVNPVQAAPDYAAHLLFMPAAEIVSMLPITPGGVGTLEGAIEQSYRYADMPDGAGLLTGVAYRIVTILLAVVGAVYYFVSRAEIRKAIDAADEPASAGTSGS